MSKNIDDCISETAAAELLPFSKSKLRNLRVAGGGPPHYDFGGKAVYYDPEEVIEWREAHYRPGGSPEDTRQSA